MYIFISWFGANLVLCELAYLTGILLPLYNSCSTRRHFLAVHYCTLARHQRLAHRTHPENPTRTEPRYLLRVGVRVLDAFRPVQGEPPTIARFPLVPLAEHHV